jgi:ketosteroid isomerase-like protein
MPALEETRRGNAELVDRLFTLSNRCAIGDASAMSELLACYHEDAEVRSTSDVVPANGRPADLIRRYFEGVREKCYLWVIYADELQEHGDRVVALGGLRTVDRGSHEDAERSVGWVFEVRDGKVCGVHSYPAYTDAIAAARERD